MAASLRPPFSPLTLHHPTSHHRHLTVRCGPRDHRGPLMKGRILSIEAITAIQTLKHAHTTLKSDAQLTNTLTRLIKSDLLAVLNELLRQGHCEIALRVFSAVKSEPGYAPDLATYAALVRALATAKNLDEIDRVVSELDSETAGSGGILQWGDEKSLVKLIRALVEAQRRESTVRVYGMMKRSGWGVEGSGVVMDEYAAKVVVRGLRVLGEAAMADEVQAAYERYLKAGGGLHGVGTG